MAVRFLLLKLNAAVHPSLYRVPREFWGKAGAFSNIISDKQPLVRERVSGNAGRKEVVKLRV